MVRTCSEGHHTRDPAQITDAAGNRTWLTRAANFVISISEVAPGSVMVREDNPDEYMIMLPQGVDATITTDGEARELAGYSLTIVPPGRSSIRFHGTGQVLRAFSSRCKDLADLSINAAAYAEPPGDTAPLVNWPDPPAGFKLRTYDLADAARRSHNAFWRVFRSTNLMINIIIPRPQPRDIRDLSPHAHADFEQASVSLAGVYVHDIRYPWGPDRTQWRPDQELAFVSPGVLVAPPGVIHTTRDVTRGAWMLDVYAPPRLDFSLMPGVVLNADDYPLPA